MLCISEKQAPLLSSTALIIHTKSSSSSNPSRRCFAGGFGLTATIRESRKKPESAYILEEKHEAESENFAEVELNIIGKTTSQHKPGKLCF